MTWVPRTHRRQFPAVLQGPMGPGASQEKIQRTSSSALVGVDDDMGSWTKVIPSGIQGPRSPGASQEKIKPTRN